MQRDFFDENFERFLRRNANNFRMEASDRVWNQLSKELQRRRRRVNLSLLAVLLVTSTLGYYFVSNNIKPVHEQQAVASERTIQQSTAPFTQKSELPQTQPQENSVAAAKAPKQIVVASRMVSVTEPHAATQFVAPTSVDVVSAVPTEVSEMMADVQPEQSAREVELIASATELTQPEFRSLAALDNKIETTALQLNPGNNFPPEADALAANISIRKKKLDWQLSFTPTISYRKLGENRSYLRNSTGFPTINAFAPLNSVNTAVTHKPDVGFEIGVATKYKLTEHLKLIGGFQFNVNRYDIKAFNAPYSMGTIRLNNGNSISSVNTLTSISNTNGYQSDWLKNLYFQASVPIGLELKLRGTDNMHFGIATSVQPSYLLGDRAYLLTSDYKSYVQVPWLVRRWNANTNLQTFVTYSTGKMRWQVGPQVRYQLLSSFISKYPVKENLFDFGMKVGISLSKE